MSNYAEIVDKLEKIQGILDLANADLQAGKVKALTQLEKDVSQICEEAVTLPPEEAKKVQPLLADMIGNLETFALTLKSFQTAMKEKVK